MNIAKAPCPAWKIRKADLADAVLLAPMNWQLIRDEGHANAMTMPQLQERMMEWLAESYTAWLMEDHNIPIAYCLTRIDGEDLYIRQLFVVAAHRRCGMARALLEHLRNTAWVNRRLRVECLLGNPTGLVFWRSVGFTDYCLTLIQEPQQTPITAQQGQV